MLLDIFAFRRMITPWLVQLVFWLGCAFTVFAGVYVWNETKSENGAMAALMLFSIPVNIVVWRVFCELVILLFRMNETLTDMKNLLHD